MPAESPTTLSVLLSTIKFLLYAFLIFIGVNCIYIGIQSMRGRAFVDAYRSIHLEQPRDAVEKAFRGPPELSLEIGGCTCVYFEGVGMFAGSATPPASPPASLQELPYVYDSAQVLFDAGQKVIAFAWVGEGGGTSSVAGAITHKSDIRSLPPEILATLKERCVQ